MMIRKTRLRLTAVMTALLMILLVAVLAAMNLSLRKAMEDNAGNLLRMAAQQEGSHISRFPVLDFSGEHPHDPHRDQMRMDEFAASRKLADTITIKFSREGKILGVITRLETGENTAGWDSAELIRLFAGEGEQGISRIDGTSYYYLRQPREYGGILVLLSRYDDQVTLRQLTVISAAALLLGLIGIVLVCYLLSGWAVRPLVTAWEKQKRFIADASHELKTPLTVISANLDVVQANGGEAVDSQKKWLDYIRGETQRMNGLVGELLCLARLDGQQEKPAGSGEICSFSDIAAGESLSFESVIFEAGRQLDCRVEEGIAVCCHRESLAGVVRILLDNALKHSDEGSTIGITLRRERGNAVLSCSNRGTYIPPEMREKIFERFFRADSSRNRATGGSGLGLSIAEETVRAWGGSIRCESEKDGLTVFTVTLKTAK